MGVDNGKMILPLPQLPQGIPPEMYGEIVRLYNAINVLKSYISLYCGVDPAPSDEWSVTSPLTSLQLGNLGRLYVPAFEDMTAGMMVNLFSDAGVLKARKASASSVTTIAHAILVDTVTAGASCHLNLFQSITAAVIGLTTGERYYLSTVAGLVTNTVPVTSGTVRQPVGIALGEEIFAFNVELQVTVN